MKRFPFGSFVCISLSLAILTAWAYMPAKRGSARASFDTALYSEPSDRSGAGIKNLQKAVAQNPQDRSLRLEYAEALFRQNNYAAAHEQYAAADFIETIEDPSVLYGMAVCAVQLGLATDNDLMARSVEQGFSDYNRLLEDPRMEPWRQERNFWNTYSELFMDNGAALAKGLWSFFPSSGKNSFVLNIKDLYKEVKTKDAPTIPYNFDQIIAGAGDALFSRGGGDNFFPEMAYRHTKNYYALIYCVELPWTDDEILPRTYRMVTYDHQGKVISDVELAHRNATSCQTVEMEGDRIRIQDFGIEYVENKVRVLSSGKTTQMTIQTNGEIVIVG